MSIRPIRNIGVFTSGGDCAGLNAVIRAITLHAVHTYQWQVYGIVHGLGGLLQDPPQTLKLTSLHASQDVLRQGGTLLGSASCEDLRPCSSSHPTSPDVFSQIASQVKALDLDALIGIGGDGSLKVLKHLSCETGVPLVCIPKTIDNDVGSTESAVGFSTAVDVATEALDRLQPTAASHDRIMILQVMGRDAGHIALHSGIAGGADIILIPEIPYRLDYVHQKIHQIRSQGRHYALMVVAESVLTPEGSPAIRHDAKGRDRYDGIGDILGEHLQTLTGAETRVTVLGHVQRGGQPNPYDRVLASAFGVHAVDLVAQGKWGRMVAWRDRQVIEVPLEQGVRHTQSVDVHGPMVHTARGLGICFGDLPSLVEKA